MRARGVRSGPLCGRAAALRTALCLAALAAASSALAAPPRGHNQLFSGRWFHAPVADDDCGVCHTMHGDSVGPYLQAPVPELCYQCHEDVAAKDVVHEPVGAGRCSDCHRAHTSDVRPLLNRKVPELCIECHPVDPAHVGRGTVCVSCHGVHSSETSRFLKDERTRNCKGCHEDKQKGERVHDPARGGKCLTCHFTHPDPRFTTERVRASYPISPRAPFREGIYGLCDRCHRPELYEDDGFLETGFRTGVRNLHAVHVSTRGIACSACHDVHSARRPALIVEWVRLPDAKPAPMQYLSFGAGGSCGPACHATATYLREEDRAEMSGDEP